MTAGRICVRDVVIAEKEMPVIAVARLMRNHHVGTVVVAEHYNGLKKPVGIVTDRDLVLEVMALEIEADKLTVGDIMSRELVSVYESDSLWDVAKKMRLHGVRRVPVINGQGGLVGILSIDDFAELIAGELADLLQAVNREQARERASRQQL